MVYGTWSDLTFFCTLSSGSSMVSFTLTEPESTVPVSTVPCPLTGKQWSTDSRNGPSADRRGSSVISRRVSI